MNNKTKRIQMNIKPNLSNIHLETCCHESVDSINRILWSGKWLQRIMIPAVFGSLFVSPTDAMGRGGALTTIVAIHQTDWKLLIEATIGISDIAKRQCMKISFRETLRHGGKLSNFWEGMVDVFS